MQHLLNHPCDAPIDDHDAVRGDRVDNRGRVRAVYDNYVPGLIGLAGVALVAVGSVMPWLREETASLSVPILGVNIGVQPAQTAGGLHDGGIYVLGLDGIVLLMVLALMSQRRRRGLLSRLGMVAGGAAVIVLGIALISRPEQLYSQHWLLRDLSKLSLVSIKAITGAYLLTGGGALLALGALTPARQNAP